MASPHPDCDELAAFLSPIYCPHPRSFPPSGAGWGCLGRPQLPPSLHPGSRKGSRALGQSCSGLMGRGGWGDGRGSCRGPAHGLPLRLREPCACWVWVGWCRRKVLSFLFFFSFPIAGFPPEQQSWPGLVFVRGEECGGGTGEAAIVLCLPTAHAGLGQPSRRQSLALVMGCCQQMTEREVCVRLPARPPFRPAVCVGLAAGTLVQEEALFDELSGQEP